VLLLVVCSSLSEAVYLYPVVLYDAAMSSETDSPIEPAPEAGTESGFWRSVGEAIRGVPRDYTKGSIGRAVLLLAIPMVLEMSMQSLFMVVDVFFVGKLGPDAVAVVGLCDSLLALVFSIAIGLSMGAAAMVARRVGEGNLEEAAVAAVQVIAVGFVLSIPIAVLGIVFAPESLRIMGASVELSMTGAGFTAIILGGNVTVMLLFLINAVFRGAGDPAVAMRALWIANLINIGLDPLLIFGLGPFPELGLEGAAIATTVGRGIGVVYQLWKLGDGSGHLVVGWADVRLVPDVMLRLLRVSGIGILQYLVSTASFLGLVRILALFGDVALAGYTIAVRLIIFVLLPAWGMGNAAATLVGQNLGAGDAVRAEKSVWFTARCNTVFLGLVAIIFVFFARPLVAVFVPQEDVVAIAADCLRIFSYSYIFWGFGVIAVMAFNGAGDTTTPTWINFWVYWVFQIPLAWILAVTMGWGPTGVFWAICLSQLLLAAVGVTAFRRGTWKTREI
jgi:putative MATE family efflux protein